MAHPPRFSDDDPYLARLREVCLAMPEAKEKISHGHPAFYTKKIFAIFGGLVKGDHDSDRYSQSVLLLPDGDEREALLGDDRFFDPVYYGPSGWVGFDFRASGEPDDVDWEEVAELIDESFRNTATAALVRRLDA